MEDIIARLGAVRNALGTISIISTRPNLNALLGSMQALDEVISALQNLKIDESKEAEA